MDWLKCGGWSVIFLGCVASWCAVGWLLLELWRVF